MADGDTRPRLESHDFATSLLAGLARSGIQHVSLCPGSRSTPLAIAAARTPGLRLHVHVDERSAAFFALGAARATRRPAALICTSGTAAANFHPAIVEARYGRVPLVVLTADRPPELREWGAGQTIDQTKLFGTSVLLFAEAPVPAPGVALPGYAQALASRAAAVAAGPPAGPVHLNLPFREPLEPPEPPLDAARPPDVRDAETRIPHLHTRMSSRCADPALLDEIERDLRASARGVIACGAQDRDAGLPAALARLASALGWPVLAESTSQLRSGAHVRSAPFAAHFDLFLRAPACTERWAPDCVLRFGDTPTGRPLRSFLAANAGARRIDVDPDGTFHQPAHAPATLLVADPAPLCHALAARFEAARPAPSALLRPVLEADALAAASIGRVLRAEPALLAPEVVRSLAASIPDGATLVLSSSMPVRDADAFWPLSERRLRVLCNKGANGIDGVVSTALGAATAEDTPVVLLTGDLAFLHDVGGLFAARHVRGSCTIVVLHDDGGSIFSYLPIAARAGADAFRELFRVPHGLALAPAAALYGLRHERVPSREALAGALARSVGRPGVHVIEVPIDAASNEAHHHALWRAVAAAQAPKPAPLRCAP